MDDTCATLRPLLSGLADGELDEPTRRRIEAHLSSCPACARRLESLRAQDRLVRRAAESESDHPARDEQALAATLARLREEPRAAWESEPVLAAARAGLREEPPPTPESERLAPSTRSRWKTRPRWPFWTVRVRWITGLAAATAAVLLALRLGPYPLAPELPRSIPTGRLADRTVASQESPSIPPAALEKPAPAEDQARKSQEAPATVGKSTRPVEPRAKAAEPPPAAAPGFAAQIERDAASQPKDEGAVGTTDLQAARQTAGQQAAPATQPQEAPGADRADRVEPTADAGAKPVARAQAEEGARSEASAPAPAREERVVALAPDSRTEQKAPSRKEDREGSGLGKGVRSLADRLRGGSSGPMTSFQFRGNRSEPAQEPSFPALADTADGSIENWAALLAEATRALAREERSGLPAATAAERWRTIGDLWEWLGRAENDPSASVRAIEAYERAREIAGPDAGIDPARLRRAQRGAAVTSPEGNRIRSRR